MLDKFSLFFRRILLILFLFIEILFIFILFYAQTNHLWIIVLIIITLVVYLAVNWILKALSN